jgi:hypothetical protein
MRRLILAATLLTAILRASAANGWYLLIPPRSNFNEGAEFLSGYKILDDKPLSEWAQYSAYDSASECETARNVLVKAESSIYQSSLARYLKVVGEQTDPAVLSIQRLSTEASNANVSAYTASRCIRSNDPRLQGPRERAR